jgi:hypothetical protein
VKQNCTSVVRFVLKKDRRTTLARPFGRLAQGGCASRQAENAGMRAMRAGIELMHMIGKGQFATDDAKETSFADQFHAPAGLVRPV